MATGLPTLQALWARPSRPRALAAGCAAAEALLRFCCRHAAPCSPAALGAAQAARASPGAAGRRGPTMPRLRLLRPLPRRAAAEPGHCGAPAAAGAALLLRAPRGLAAPPLQQQQLLLPVTAAARLPPLAPVLPVRASRPQLLLVPQARLRLPAPWPAASWGRWRASAAGVSCAPAGTPPAQSAQRIELGAAAGQGTRCSAAAQAPCPGRLRERAAQPQAATPPRPSAAPHLEPGAQLKLQAAAAAERLVRQQRQQLLGAGQHACLDDLRQPHQREVAQLVRARARLRRQRRQQARRGRSGARQLAARLMVRGGARGLAARAAAQRQRRWQLGPGGGSMQQALLPACTMVVQRSMQRKRSGRSCRCHGCAPPS